MFGSTDFNVTPNKFSQYILLLIKLHKAFKQFDTAHTNYISQRNLIIIIKSFGFSKHFKTEFQSMIELFDHQNEEKLYEFEEIVSIIISIEKLCIHFSDSKPNNAVLFNVGDVHSILISFGVSVNAEEVGLVIARTSKESYMKWNFNEYAQFLVNIKNNLHRLKHIISNKFSKKGALGSVKDLNLSDDIMKAKIIEKIDLAKLKAILTECRNKKTLFIDHEFAPSSPLFIDRPDVQSVVESWKRPSELTQHPCLFSDGVNEGSLQVTSESGNWYLSALAILTRAGNKNLEKMFVAKYPQYGIYQCRFYKDGDWCIVTIDDRIPCTEDNTPAFARSRDSNEFWVPLLEKAYAKLYGSYSAIQSGSIGEALRDFTGEPVEEIDVLYSQELWDILKLYTEESWIMGCTSMLETAPRVSDLGIIKNHTYNIIRCLEVGEFKLLELRNPWGEFSWKGRWSEGSRQWNDQLLQDISPDFQDTNVFYIDFVDWCREFSNLHVLRIHSTTYKGPRRWDTHQIDGNWTKRTAGGCTNFPSWPYNPQYKFLNNKDEDNVVFISSSHKNKRQGSFEASYPSHGIIVIAMDDPNGETKKREAFSEEIVAISSYSEERDVTTEFVAKPNKAYVIIPTTYEPNIIGKYFLTIQSNHGGEVFALKGDRQVSYHGEWSKEKNTNGGGITCPTWRYSPQYFLNITHKCKIRITLTQEIVHSVVPIAFTIFKNGDSSKRHLDYGEFVLLPQNYVRTESVASEVAFEPGNYSIMCAAELPEYESSYTLVLNGAEDSFSLSDIGEYIQYKAEEEWDEALSGGCKNHPTWVKNPRFAFILKEKTEISIVHRLNEICNDHAIGFYIFLHGDQNPQLIAKSKFKHNSVSIKVTLEPGTYLVLPCTFEPGVLKKFALEFYTTINIVLFNVRTKQEIKPI